MLARALRSCRTGGAGLQSRRGSSRIVAASFATAPGDTGNLRMGAARRDRPPAPTVTSAHSAVPPPEWVAELLAPTPARDAGPAPAERQPRRPSPPLPTGTTGAESPEVAATACRRRARAREAPATEEEVAATGSGSRSEAARGHGGASSGDVITVVSGAGGELRSAPATGTGAEGEGVGSVTTSQTSPARGDTVAGGARVYASPRPIDMGRADDSMGGSAARAAAQASVGSQVRAARYSSGVKSAAVGWNPSYKGGREVNAAPWGGDARQTVAGTAGTGAFVEALTSSTAAERMETDAGGHLTSGRVTEGAAGWQEAARAAGYSAAATATFSVRRSGGAPGSATGRVGAGAGVPDVSRGSRDFAAIAAYNAAAEAGAPACGDVGSAPADAATTGAASTGGAVGGERAFIDFGARLGGVGGGSAGSRRLLHTRAAGCGSDALTSAHIIRGVSTSRAARVDLRPGSPAAMVLPAVEEAVGPEAMNELEHRWAVEAQLDATATLLARTGLTRDQYFVTDQPTVAALTAANSAPGPVNAEETGPGAYRSTAGVGAAPTADGSGGGVPPPPPLQTGDVPLSGAMAASTGGGSCGKPEEPVIGVGSPRGGGARTTKARAAAASAQLAGLRPDVAGDPSTLVAADGRATATLTPVGAPAAPAAAGDDGDRNRGVRPPARYPQALRLGRASGVPAYDPFTARGVGGGLGGGGSGAGAVSAGQQNAATGQALSSATVEPRTRGLHTSATVGAAVGPSGGTPPVRPAPPQPGGVGGTAGGDSAAGNESPAPFGTCPPGGGGMGVAGAGRGTVRGVPEDASTTGGGHRFTGHPVPEPPGGGVEGGTGTLPRDEHWAAARGVGDVLGARPTRPPSVRGLTPRQVVGEGGMATSGAGPARLAQSSAARTADGGDGGDGDPGVERVPLPEEVEEQGGGGGRGGGELPPPAPPSPAQPWPGLDLPTPEAGKTFHPPRMPPRTPPPRQGGTGGGGFPPAPDVGGVWH